MIGSNASRPPRKGRNGCGIRTLPSACWWFSKIMMMVRVMAQSVPFRVATGPIPVANRALMFSRLAWNSVQLRWR